MSDFFCRTHTPKSVHVEIDQREKLPQTVTDLGYSDSKKKAWLDRAALKGKVHGRLIWGNDAIDSFELEEGPRPNMPYCIQLSDAIKSKLSPIISLFIPMRY